MIGHLVRLPVRLWALATAAYVVSAGLVAPLARAAVESAVHAAGETTLSVGTVPQLAATPVAWALAVGALVLACGAALGWTAVTIAIAANVLDGESRTLPALRRTGQIVATWCRTGVAGLAIPLATFPSLVGFTAFSPASNGLAIAPFIPREFLKSPITGGVWALLLAALAAASFAILVALVRFSDDRRTSGGTMTLPRPARLWRLAAIIATIAALSVAVQDAVPAGVGVIAAQAAALALVGHLRATASPQAAASHTRRFRGSIAVGAAVLAMGTAVTGLWAAAPPASEAALRDDVVVIAHRGFDRGGPENTILALEAAAEVGTDIVEVDVQQTADGGLVASHDTNLTVLAGINRNIWEMTTAEVTRVNVGMHGNTDRIPTVREYVSRAMQLDMPLLIELKVTGHEVTDLVPTVLAELEAIGGLEGNLFHSLDAPTVEELERERPELRTGMTLAMIAGGLPKIDCDFFVVEEASVTASMVASAHDRGMPLYAWTVNSDRSMRSLLDEGVDGIITDRIDSSVLRGATSPTR